MWRAGVGWVLVHDMNAYTELIRLVQAKDAVIGVDASRLLSVLMHTDRLLTCV